MNAIEESKSHVEGTMSFPIHWEEVNCHLCMSIEPPEPVLLYGRPLVTGQFGYEVHPKVCRCGLVYLNPRWTSATYNEFYTKHYDALYRLEVKPDYGKEGVRNHMRQVWTRIKPYLNGGKSVGSVLDVGCGSGYGLQYLKEELPHISISGIEASPDCCRILQEEVGASLLASDVDGAWLEENRGRFDLIIMRHVAEHFLTPVETLRRLKSALAPRGVLYIAVPDMMHPRTVLRDYDKWWEYWFRAVHTYYYSKETLFATVQKAGMYPFAFREENEEVWCLVDGQERNVIMDGDLHKKQVELLMRQLPVKLR